MGMKVLDLGVGVGLKVRGLGKTCCQDSTPAAEPRLLRGNGTEARLRPSEPKSVKLSSRRAA